MTAQHSPLPWKFVGFHEAIKGRVGSITTEDGTSTIAIVLGTSLDSKPENPINKIALANADLIVRAANAMPELIEALKRITRTDFETFGGDHQRFLGWLHAFALSTIKAAEGQTRSA